MTFVELYQTLFSLLAKRTSHRDIEFPMAHIPLLSFFLLCVLSFPPDSDSQKCTHNQTYAMHRKVIGLSITKAINIKSHTYTKHITNRRIGPGSLLALLFFIPSHGPDVSVILFFTIFVLTFTRRLSFVFSSFFYFFSFRFHI